MSGPGRWPELLLSLLLVASACGVGGPWSGLLGNPAGPASLGHVPAPGLATRSTSGTRLGPDLTARAAGFSPPLVLSTGATSGNVNGGPPNAPSSAASVVDNSSGNPYVAFASNVSGAWEIYFTLGSTTGTSFSAPVDVSGAPPTNSEYVSPSVSLNAGGTEACMTFLRTLVANPPMEHGDYEETCSTDGGATWSPLQSDNGTAANVCQWGSLLDPVGSFDASGNYVVNYLCRDYYSTKNDTLILGWDTFSPANAFVGSYSLPIAAYTSYAPTLSFSCGSATSGCATVYSISDRSDAHWDLLVVTSTSDFSTGSIFGPVAIESDALSGTHPGLEVYPGGLAYAANGTLSAVAYLSFASGSSSSYNVHFAWSTNGWASMGALTVDPAPPPGAFASGLSAPALALEGANGAPFVVWENASATQVFDVAASTPGGAWSPVLPLSAGGGSPSLALLPAGASAPWREDLVFVGTSSPAPVEYAQLSGPSVGALLADHPEGEVGATVNFTAASTTGGFPPFTYAWTLAPTSGLGCGPSTGPRIACVPASAGTFSISVQAMDSAGFLSPAVSLSGFLVVTALSASAPVGWPGASGGDVGQSTFVNTTVSGGAAPYAAAWYGLPAGCSSSTTPSVGCTLSGPPGGTSVVARVTDLNNYNVTTAALAYTVYGSLAVSSVSGSPDPALTNAAVAFSATVVGGAPALSYLWSFGHGATSTQAAPSYTFTSGGSYPIWLNVTDGAGITARGTMTESVDPSLGVSATASPTTANVGQVVYLNATVTGGTSPYTYSWNFGDGSHGSGAQAQHAYPTPGGFTAVVFVNDSLGASAKASVSVAVSAAGSGLKVSTATGDPNPANTTTPVLFSVSASGGVAPYSYLWNFGDGTNDSLGARVSHLFTAPSSGSGYLVNITVSDSAGDSDSQTFYERVAQGSGLPPLVVDSLTASPSLDEVGLPVGLTVATQGGEAPLQYSWTFGDGETSQGTSASVDHDYRQSGPYTAQVTVQDARGETGYAQATVTILPAPSATLVADPTSGVSPVKVTLVGTTNGGEAPFFFQFHFGGGLVSPSQPNSSIVHTFVSAGTFEVTMVATDALGGTTTADANVTVGAASPPSSGGSPVSGSSLGELLDPDLLLLVAAAVLVAAILVAAFGQRRGRGPEGSAPAASMNGSSLDQDLMAPDAAPPIGAITDDTAEDGGPTVIPDRYPMLPPKATVPASSPLAPVSPSPPATSLPPPSSPSTPTSASAPGPSVATSQEAPARSPVEPPPPSAPETTAPAITRCLLCGNPLRDRTCDSCGMTC